MSFSLMMIMVPYARTHREITEAGMLFFVSSTLSFGVTLYSGMGENSYWALGEHAPLLPLFICLMTFALLFGVRFSAVFLKKKDTFSKIIASLLAFHLMNLCLYVYLVWIISVRSVPAGN